MRDGKAGGNNGAAEIGSEHGLPPAEHVAKRQRTEEGSAAEAAGGRTPGQVPIVERPEDEQETQERVPMARSSMYAALPSQADTVSHPGNNLISSLRCSRPWPRCQQRYWIALEL